jgi:hypothetical protein
MLRSNRDGVSVRMNGKEGWVSGTRSRQHSALSLPLVAFLGMLGWRGDVAMAASDGGICKAGQWWPIDLEARMTDTTMGVGIEVALQLFRPRVLGNRGCDYYMRGKPTHAAGSSAAPPTVEPQR